MAVSEYSRDGFLISTDKTKLNLGVIHQYLSGSSYWAQGRPLEVVKTSIEHSLCFGVYAANLQQVGFARVVTDYATIAWICDLFILESCQGKGLGKWLVEVITTYPALQGLKRLLLATRDAHELYRRYGGFQALRAPDMWMERSTFG
jgi:GNAT superfamily N-acetyltransferase